MRYCSYKSICNFDSKMANNDYNYIPNREKADILEEIKIDYKIDGIK